MSQDKKQDHLDEEFDVLHQEGASEFASKLKENKEKASVAFKEFVGNLGQEAKETGEASKIIVKYFKEGRVSEDEEKELRTQVYDLLKMVGIGIPFFMIPGSSLLMPFLVKIAEKRGVNVLPTAFTKEEDEDQSKQS